MDSNFYSNFDFNFDHESNILKELIISISNHFDFYCHFDFSYELNILLIHKDFHNFLSLNRFEARGAKVAS